MAEQNFRGRTSKDILRIDCGGGYVTIGLKDGSIRASSHLAGRAFVDIVASCAGIQTPSAPYPPGPLKKFFGRLAVTRSSSPELLVAFDTWEREPLCTFVAKKKNAAGDSVQITVRQSAPPASKRAAKTRASSLCELAACIRDGMAARRSPRELPALRTERPLIETLSPLEGFRSADSAQFVGWGLDDLYVLETDGRLLGWADPARPPREIVRLPGASAAKITIGPASFAVVQRRAPSSGSDDFRFDLIDLRDGSERQLATATRAFAFGTTRRNVGWHAGGRLVALSGDRPGKPTRSAVAVFDVVRREIVDVSDDVDAYFHEWDGDELVLMQENKTFRWRPGFTRPKRARVGPRVQPTLTEIPLVDGIASPDGSVRLIHVDKRIVVRRHDVTRQFRVGRKSDLDALSEAGVALDEQGRGARWFGNSWVVWRSGDDYLAADLLSGELRYLAPFAPLALVTLAPFGTRAVFFDNDHFVFGEARFSPRAPLRQHASRLAMLGRTDDAKELLARKRSGHP